MKKAYETDLNRVRFFKRSKNGVLDGIGRAETREYAEMLLREGYEECTKEYYERIVNMNLYISYRLE